MYEVIISEYIKKLSLKDINVFANKNNMILKQGEDLILYKFIINYWREIYKGNTNEAFIKLKESVSNETYNNAMLLYNQFKNKIK